MKARAGRSRWLILGALAIVGLLVVVLVVQSGQRSQETATPGDDDSTVQEEAPSDSEQDADAGSDSTRSEPDDGDESAEGGAGADGADSADDAGGADNDDGASADVDADDEDPRALNIDEPERGPLASEGDEFDRVSQGVASVVNATNQVARNADGGIEGLEKIADGFVLGELQALAADRSHLGYSQKGEPEIVGVELMDSDLDSAPPAMSVAVCLDYSDVDIVDSAGESRRDLLYDPGHPVQYVYGAEYEGDMWKVVSSEPSDGSDCSDG